MKKVIFGFLIMLLLPIFLVDKVYANTEDKCPDGYTKEETVLESIIIPCGPTKEYKTSENQLKNGVPYVLEASGTCNWRRSGSTNGYLGDAEYWLRNDAYGDTWTKMNPGSIAFWKDSTAQNIDWGDFNENHVYYSLYSPTVDNNATFYFYDDNYSDNSGSLTLNIYKCRINRRAEITKPELGTVLNRTTDTLKLEANLIDDDIDPVQWAVRKGTCDKGTNNIIGNVDGMTNEPSWLSDTTNSNKYLFTAESPILDWEEGMYCFIFNPTEGSGEGEADLRETREFYVDDGDGIIKEKDLCKGSTTDTFYEKLGTNRWAWNINKGWETQLPKNGKGPQKNYDIEKTSGCTCSQILEWLNKYNSNEYGEMEGHWKFGCSSSVLDDFIWLNK